MKIYEDTTRFVFKDYSDKDLQILRRLISADGNTFLYEDEDYVACPIGVEKYIRRKFPEEHIEERPPWESTKMKFIPKNIPEPRNRLQKEALKFLRENKDRTQLGLITKTGSGKAQSYSTLIPTPTGVRRMGDLHIGDRVFTQSGKETTIMEIHEQGKQDVYRFTFEDGRTTEATKEHLWEVIRFDQNSPTGIVGTDLMTSEIEELLNNGEKLYVPLCDPVEYRDHHSELCWDTYIHGVMLFHRVVNPKIFGGAIMLSGMTPELLTKLGGMGLHLVKWKRKIYAVTNQQGNNLLLSGDRYDEFFDEEILDKILYGTVHQRQQFMNGILETGTNVVTVGNINHITFHHDDPNVVKKILQIAYSLGWKGELVTEHMGDILPMYPDNDRSRLLQITDIKQLYGKKLCRCISVADPSHLYLTTDYIVTHNTYMSINHAIRVGEKTLVICPTTQILEQWVNSLTNMFQIPKERILHITGTEKLSKMNQDYDWVLVLEQTLQTLVKHHDLEQRLRDAKFGLKITDEIHMFLRNNIAIDCSSNIKRSLYCTGTFFRTQEEESNLFNAIYHNILRFEVVEEKEVERYGQPKHIEVYSVVINSKLTKREVSHIVIMAKIGRKTVPTVSVGRYMDIVCPRDGRITPYMEQSLQVIKRMRERVDYGRMLILVPSIYSTQQFRKLIANMYPKLKVGCINSEQSRYLNNTVKEEADIVVSTSKSAGVGFDMADLSILVAVEQFRSPVLVEQISGRLRPRKDKKHTYYVDIADAALGSYLLRWREDRLERLKKKAVSYRQFRVSGDK